MSDQTNAGEIVLVTGGSRGLGRHTAPAAAQAGFNIIITYHSNKAAAEAVPGEIRTGDPPLREFFCQILMDWTRGSQGTY